MASSRALERSVEQITSIACQSLDSVALRSSVLGAISAVLDFDAYVWLLTDPVTAVGSSPLAEVPVPLSQLPGLIRAKYCTPTGRWTSLMNGEAPVALWGGDGQGDETIGSTDLGAFLRRFAVHDVASIAFADSFGCWGFLDLWRSEDRRSFEEVDGEFLSGVAPAITSALRECQARTFVEPARPRRRDVGPVVLALDDDLRIAGRTAVTQSWLDALLPPDPGMEAVPASVYNVAAQLLAVEGGVDDHPATTRAHLGDGFWVTLRAARIADDSPVADRIGRPAREIVVTIEESSTLERLDLLARTCAFTPRERQLTTLLASGSDTRGMARAMHLSTLTVQDHLKAIFGKTGAHDRVELLARALGTRPGIEA